MQCILITFTTLLQCKGFLNIFKTPLFHKSCLSWIWLASVFMTSVFKAIRMVGLWLSGLAFWDMLSLLEVSPGWTWTWDLPALASWVLGPRCGLPCLAAVFCFYSIFFWFCCQGIHTNIYILVGACGFCMYRRPWLVHMYMHTVTVIFNMLLSVLESGTGDNVLRSNPGCLEMSWVLCSEACLLSLSPV